MRYVPFFLSVLVLLCCPVMAVTPEVIPDGSDLSPVPTVAVSPDQAGSLSDQTPALEVAPSKAPYLQGGFFFDCLSALGRIRLYVPSEWSTDRLALTSNGSLFNLSTSTLYAYCPDHPDLEFYARRFSEFSYRDRSDRERPLQVSSISDTNILFMSDSAPRPSQYSLLLLLTFFAFLMLLFKLCFRW